MEQVISIKPNQSFLDAVLQGSGTIESGMQIAADNNLAISHLPDVGDSISVSDAIRQSGDQNVLQYLSRNAITPGTKGIAPALMYRVVLKPVMMFSGVPKTAATPYYEYNLEATPDFINLYDLVPNYLSNNEVVHTNFGYPGPTIDDEVVSPMVITPMTDKRLNYKPTYFPWDGNPLIYSRLGDPVISTTFVDVKGNTAYVAPVLTLDPSELLNEITPAGYMLSDIEITVLSATANDITLKLSCAPIPIGAIVPITAEVTWLGDAALGEPYAPDALIFDLNSISLTLGPGTYTFGVRTAYFFAVVSPAIPWPSSAFTMVIEVGHF